MTNAVLKGAALGALILSGDLATSQAALADDARTYEVTVRNATLGQIVTPTVLVPHNADYSLFQINAPASPGLALLAESGDTSTLLGELDIEDDVDSDGVGVTGPLLPGETVIAEITTLEKFLSTAAMLARTNDAFASVRGIALPKGVGHSVTVYANAYDAGSEFNSELGADIPAPPFNGAGFSAPHVTDEDLIHVHSGVHGGAGLDPAVHDWRNPVVEITITRIDDD